VHQSFTYLDRSEQVFRLGLAVIGTLVSAIVLSFISGYPVWHVWNIVISFLVIHTLNWIFNGNWWACILFTLPNLKNPGDEATCQYLNTMAKRVRKSSSISGILIFGSASRHAWHNRSDIDLRLIHRPGLKNALAANFITMGERFLAFLARQPIDMYLGDDVEFLKKMRKDEQPLFLIKRDKSLDLAYPNIKESRLKTLKSSAKLT